MNDLAQRLAERLKRPGPADAPPPPAAEAAALAALTETIGAQAQTGRRRRILAVGAALAAAVLAFVGASAGLRPRFDGLEVETAHQALVTHGDTSVAAAAGGRVVIGAKIQTTTEGSVRMRFPTGSEVWLEQRSALELLSAGVDQSMRLSAGRVLAQVAPLQPGQRFRISTPDTELSVRGTRFSVEWLGVSECAGQAATRVHVEEGTVWVRHGQTEAVVEAGGRWPAGCPPAAGPAPVAELAPPPRPAATGSRLAEENRRFGEVQRERQAGRFDRALELLDRLKQDFPRGQLEEDVAAEEMRLAADREPARARRAAKAYLKRFPQGYARSLAEDLAGRAP